MKEKQVKVASLTPSMKGVFFFRLPQTIYLLGWLNSLQEVILVLHGERETLVSIQAFTKAWSKVSTPTSPTWH